MLGGIYTKKSIQTRDIVETNSPSEDVSTPAMPENDVNVLEPWLNMGFTAFGPTSDIYRVSKAFAEVLKQYPEVKILYTRTSLGRLWIVDGKPDG